MIDQKLDKLAMLPVLDVLDLALSVGTLLAVHLSATMLDCRPHHVSTLHYGGVPLLEQLVEGVVCAEQSVQEISLALLFLAIELLFQTRTLLIQVGLLPRARTSGRNHQACLAANFAKLRLRKGCW